MAESKLVSASSSIVETLNGIVMLSGGDKSSVFSAVVNGLTARAAFSVNIHIKLKLACASALNPHVSNTA
jgi:fructose-bisphosphate aldolase class 1